MWIIEGARGWMIPRAKILPPWAPQSQLLCPRSVGNRINLIIGVRTNFFSRGRNWAIFAQKYFDSARKKLLYYTCTNLQNCFFRLTPRNKLLVKIPDYGHFISLDEMKMFYSFKKYERIFSSFCLLCSGRKFSVWPKNNGFVPLGGGGRSPLTPARIRLRI